MYGLANRTLLVKCYDNKMVKLTLYRAAFMRLTKKKIFQKHCFWILGTWWNSYIFQLNQYFPKSDIASKCLSRAKGKKNQLFYFYNLLRKTDTVGNWIANIQKENLYLFGIQMVANWMVWTIWLATMSKGSVTKCHSVTKFFTIWIANY